MLVKTNAYETEMEPVEEGRTTLIEAVPAPRTTRVRSSFQWLLYVTVSVASTNKYAPTRDTVNIQAFRNGIFLR
jgi:hypothetical protein